MAGVDASPNRSDLPDINVKTEAENATATFKEHREHDEAARKGMRDEVERIMKLIRSLRGQNGEMSAQYQVQIETQLEVRKKVDLFRETVRSVLGAFPDRFKPPDEGKDDLDSVDAAVAALVAAVNQANDDLAKTKQKLGGLKDATGRMRTDTNEMQRELDDAIYQLRQLIVVKTGKATLVDLIATAKKGIDEERRSKQEAEKVLRAEKKKMDAMLDKRRNLLGIAKQLYDRCAQTDKLTKEVGIKGSTACPVEIDEKKSLAAEFERALSWLIGQVSLAISELHSTKRRLADAEERMKKTKRNSKEVGDQLNKFEKAIQDLSQKLEDLKKKLKEEMDRNAGSKKTAEELQKKYDSEMQDALSAHESEASRWQQLSAEYDEKSKRTRQELESLSKDMGRLRGQTSTLTDRIDQALNKYLSLRDNLVRGKNEITEKIQTRVETIHKTNITLIAMETEAKDAEREAEMYSTQLDGAKKELAGRSEWRNGAKDRLDSINGQREKDIEELQKLRAEEKSLMEKIQSNERALETRNQRHQQLRDKVRELEQKQRKLESENQDLRWAREEEFPQAATPDSTPCQICASNEKLAAHLPQLELELQQLEQEWADLKQREKVLREERNRMQDAVVERKTKPSKLGRMTSTRRRTRSLPKQRRSYAATTRRSRASAQSVDRRQIVERDAGGVTVTGMRWLGSDADSSSSEIKVTFNLRVCSASSPTESSSPAESSSPVDSSRTACEEGYDVDRAGNETEQ